MPRSLMSYFDPEQDYAPPTQAADTGMDPERASLYQILASGGPDTPAPDVFRETPGGAKRATILSAVGDFLNALEEHRRSNARHPIREGTPQTAPIGAFTLGLQERRRE